MTMKRVLRLLLVAGIALATSCQVFSSSNFAARQKDDPTKGRIKLTIPAFAKEVPGLRAKALTLGNIRNIKVEVRHPKGDHFNRVASGDVIPVAFVQNPSQPYDYDSLPIPAGRNYYIRVTAQGENNQPVSGGVLWSYFSISPGENRVVDVNYCTTAVGSLIGRMVERGFPFQAERIDTGAMSGRCDLDMDNECLIDSIVANGFTITPGGLASCQQAPATINGQLLNIPPGTTSISLMARDPLSLPITITVSGSSSSYSITDLLPGSWTVTAIAGPSGLTTNRQVVSLVAGETRNDVDLDFGGAPVLFPTHGYTGSEAAIDGSQLADTQYIEFRTTSSVDPTTIIGATDSRVRFTVPNAAAGPYEVWIKMTPTMEPIFVGIYTIDVLPGPAPPPLPPLDPCSSNCGGGGGGVSTDPSITSFTPITAAGNSAVEVQIVGLNFTPIVTSAGFRANGNSYPATILSQSATEVRVTLPLLPDGAYEVYITVNDDGTIKQARKGTFTVGAQGVQANVIVHDGVTPILPPITNN